MILQEDIKLRTLVDHSSHIPFTPVDGQQIRLTAVVSDQDLVNPQKSGEFRIQRKRADEPDFSNINAFGFVGDPNPAVNPDTGSLLPSMVIFASDLGTEECEIRIESEIPPSKSLNVGLLLETF
jgi:hypothetical protein